MNKHHIFKILSTLLILATSATFADSKTYKISVLIFEHSPAEKITSTPVLTPWSDADFFNSIAIDENNALPKSESALSNAAYGLSQNSDYTILYNGTWLASFDYGQPQTFHIHKTLENNQNLDVLMQMNMKYYFDVHFQSQLLIPQSDNHLNFYNIISLDETYQAPSNQIQYIDSPAYAALIEIAKIN